MTSSDIDAASTVYIYFYCQNLRRFNLSFVCCISSKLFADMLMHFASKILKSPCICVTSSDSFSQLAVDRWTSMFFSRNKYDPCSVAVFDLFFYTSISPQFNFFEANRCIKDRFQSNFYHNLSDVVETSFETYIGMYGSTINKRTPYILILKPVSLETITP